MKAILAVAILAVIFGVLEGCDMTKRKATIAVFVSRKMRNRWVERGRFGKTDADLKEGIRNTLIPQLNTFYARSKLVHGEVTFKLVHAEVFSDAIDNEINQGNNNADILGPFCSYFTQKRANAQIALYLIDKDEQPSKLKGAAGKAFWYGVCKKGQNCAVVVGQDWHKGAAFPNLVAHEVGHLFSFRDHGPECGGIMFAPARFDDWSKCTKEILENRFVKQKYEYVCLQNDCGQVPTTVKPTLPPGSVSEEDKAVLSQACGQWLGNNAFKYGAHYLPGTDPGKFNPSSMYGQVISQNPKWYLTSRVCYGIPCVNGRRMGGIPGKFMNRRPCGVNKSCKNIVEGNVAVTATCE